MQTVVSHLLYSHVIRRFVFFIYKYSFVLAYSMQVLNLNIVCTARFIQKQQNRIDTRLFIWAITAI